LASRDSSDGGDPLLPPLGGDKFEVLLDDFNGGSTAAASRLLSNMVSDLVANPVPSIPPSINLEAWVGAMREELRAETFSGVPAQTGATVREQTLYQPEELCR
jgi:hypothetical protein